MNKYARYFGQLMKKIHISKWDLIIVTIVIIVRISFYANLSVLWAGDSEGYVNYTWFHVRTPVYPLIIDFFQLVAGDYYIYPLIVFQIVFSFISALIMEQTAYYTIKILNNNLRDSFVSTICRIVFVIYAINPSIFVWDMSVLTESIAISSTVIFIFFVVRFLNKRRAIDGVYMVLASFFAMMIRPASQILFWDLVILIVVLLFNKKCRKKLYPALFIGIALSALAFLYMSAEYEKNGTFQLSNLKPRHDLVKVLQSGLYLNYSDEELVEKIKELYHDSEWLDIVVYRQELMDLFGDSIKEANVNISEFNGYCIKTDLPTYIKHISNIFCDVLRCRFVPYANSRDGLFSLNVSIDRWMPTRMPVLFSIVRFLSLIFDGVTVFHVLLIGIFLFVSFVIHTIKRRESAYLLMGISGGILSTLVSTIIGTFSEFGRCLIETLPFYYVGLISVAIIAINWIVTTEPKHEVMLVEQ